MCITEKDKIGESERSGLGNNLNTNKDGDDYTPPPPYPRMFNDRPDSYCCDSLKYVLENHLGYIQYDARFKEFVFVHPSGEFVMGEITYCPWCGTNTNSLRDLYNKKADEYMLSGLLRGLEVREYWHILARDLSPEETMRLIDNERSKKKGDS
jgi:hypothetical protein